SGIGTPLGVGIHLRPHYYKCCLKLGRGTPFASIPCRQRGFEGRQSPDGIAKFEWPKWIAFLLAMVVDVGEYWASIPGIWALFKGRLKSVRNERLPRDWLLFT